jgi:hypothetical protein
LVELVDQLHQSPSSRWGQPVGRTWRSQGWDSEVVQAIQNIKSMWEVGVEEFGVSP